MPRSSSTLWHDEILKFYANFYDSARDALLKDRVRPTENIAICTPKISILYMKYVTKSKYQTSRNISCEKNLNSNTYRLEN